MLVLAPAACGSTSSSSSSPSASAPSSTATASSASSPAPSSSATGTTPAPAHGGTASVTTGPVRGRLHAADHAPIVNKNWPYSVVVTDAAGHPLSGTVDIEFAFAGQVVGHAVPPTHTLTNGRWSEPLQFPPQSVGQPLTFQVVAHTHLGSITLDWPVIVKR